MKLIGIARLGRDAEVKYTPGGKAVANLALAYSYGNKDGNGHKPSQWVDASLWGDQAERMGKYLLKGTVLHVVCRDVHVETFEGKNGTGHKLVGIISDIEFVPKQRDSEQKPVQKPAAKNTEDIDDLPF